MVHIDNISKAYPTKPLFSQASAHLRPNARVGLVGPNGTGKTTLLRMILNEETPDTGSIRTRPGLRIGYLPQELDMPPHQTVLEAAHRFQYPEHEAKRILSGLGFTESDWHRPLETFSGGFRMRVALGHLLLSTPDVLMLDEPTNHLDRATQAWLETFLLASNMTMLVISHDTRFLDRLATHIWEIRNYHIHEYRGNYTAFTTLRAQRDAHQATAAKRQAKEVARIQQFIDRFRYQANKARQVQSRLKQLEKIKRLEVTRDPKRLRFKFPEPPLSGKQVLTLERITKSYGERIVYRDITFSVERGQRVALVGENGAGKSTLLKLLAGVLDYDSGTRHVGHGVTLHYFAQHQAEALHPEHTVLESLAEAAPQAEMNVLRSLAGVFLFSGRDQHKLIKALSGGERNRVALARMLVNPANTLLLDEPTNHLDPASVEVLTDALVDFPGTIVFISHDPTFLSRVATRVVEIEDGHLRDYPGDYEYYLWKRAQELETLSQRDEHEPSPQIHPKSARTPQSPTASKSPRINPQRERTKAITRLEKQLARLEEEITAWEVRITQRATELANPHLYQDFTRWQALYQEHEEWKKTLETLTTRWADLATELETLKQNAASCSLS
ncbi:MAG: ABC transporter ATP-binding protein [Nitrospirae bacterium]|nr:MAG: ABC transporter ATP-binding protein [Nitrospirota bacterium]